MAQFGSAPVLGTGGRQFESGRSDKPGLVKPACGSVCLVFRGHQNSKCDQQRPSKESGLFPSGFLSVWQNGLCNGLQTRLSRFDSVCALFVAGENQVTVIGGTATLREGSETGP